MRFVQLDILRAAAVLMVLLSHIPPMPDEAGIAAAIVRFWRAYGHLGVDLFFVLSGFLVAGLLFREQQTKGSMRVGRFLVRRGFKIYPAFYVFLIATVLLRINRGDSFSMAQIASESLFVQNYGPHVWSHTWSLAVEEHFYLLLAGLFFLLGRNDSAVPFRRLPVIFAGTVLTVIVLRALTCHYLPYAAKTHDFPTHLRLEELFCGVFLSYLYHLKPAALRFVSAARVPLLLVASLLLVVRFALSEGTVGRVLGPTMVAVAFSLVVAVAMDLTAPKYGLLGRSMSSMAFLGQHSYSIYLWHTAVLVFGTLLLRKMLGTEPAHAVGAALYVLAAFAFGVLMAKVVEMPVLRLRDRLFPSQSGGQVSVGSSQEPLVMAGAPS